MEVRVDTYVEDLSGINEVVNRAYWSWLPWMMRKPGVLRLIIESESGHAEWEAGMRRHALRHKRRSEVINQMIKLRF